MNRTPARRPETESSTAAGMAAPGTFSGSAAQGLISAARGFPGPALALGPKGEVLSASPLSGLTEGMRAPFETVTEAGPATRTDSAGRRWRISAAIEGIRLAVGDDRHEPDAASRFTAAVSHEIRTPLNGILGMAALLEEGELAPDQREYALAIRKSGARLLDLLNNVLDYSRMEQGDLPLEYAPFDPADLVQDVAELLAPRAHGAGLDLAAIVDRDLPPRLIGDAGRLRQILFNLTGNAVKFTDAGAVLIEARRGRNGAGLSLIVRDTGMGIPEEARARLFEAFGQARAADARRDGGVGLGLAIVARLVASMKGEVAFDSSTGGAGAMFRVDLPLEAAPQPEPDDDVVFPRRVATIALDLPPASTLACFSALAGDRARAVPDETRADLVILDAALPPARIEATAKARRTLVVLRPEDRSRLPQFRDMGCAGYLIRPLRAASVLERVRLALAGDVETGEAAEPAAKAAGTAGRVLIADDNGVNALLASRALAAAGFHVDVAGTGAEALERAGETLYSVIFMDIRMPVMDGLEATRRIRRLAGPAAETPIVALTADIDPELEDRARQAGITTMAAKPIDPARLRQLAETMAGPLADRRIGLPDRRDTSC
jgi:signal transduction histidine kinase/CheY-like chemotaxis protein